MSEFELSMAALENDCLIIWCALCQLETIGDGGQTGIVHHIYKLLFNLDM